MAIEIVNFLINSGGSFHNYVAVYQRVFDCWVFTICWVERDFLKTVVITK